MQQAPAKVYEDHYDEQAAYWSWVYSAEESELSIYAYHFRRRRDVVLDELTSRPVPAGAKFLDAGCGPGAYSDPMLDLGYEVHCFDQSGEMVKHASENVTSERREHASFSTGTLDAIDFADNTFDVITNIAVLMYVGDPKKCVAEIGRVLKPGGLAVITVDNKSGIMDRIDIVARLGRLFGRLFGGKRETVAPAEPTTEFSPVCFSPREMRELYASAGLVETDFTSVGYAPILFNSKRILSDKWDMKLDRFLSFLRRWRFSKGWGYTYISFVTKQ